MTHGILYNEAIQTRAKHALALARESHDRCGHAGRLNTLGVPATLANSLSQWAEEAIGKENAYEDHLSEFGLHGSVNYPSEGGGDDGTTSNE